MCRSLLPCIVGILVAVWPASSVEAATFVVNSTADIVDAAPGNGMCASATGTCTLRAAIQEANALAGSDAITLPAGTYTFSLAGMDEDASATGDLDVYSVVVINGDGASTTFVDANQLGRAFELHAGGNLTLNDVTVQKGYGELVGGGVLANPGSTLALTRVVVQDNRAGLGGGIALFSAPESPTTNSIVDSTITRNGALAPPHTSSHGGGILSSSTLTITGSTISSNFATVGGALSLGEGRTLISGSTISGNTADASGGGISTRGVVTIVNTTISGNTAFIGAGALSLFRSPPGSQLVNVTIASNSSGFVELFGGAAVEIVETDLRVQNSIIANNVGVGAATCTVESTGTMTNLGNNLEFPGTACGFNLPTDVRADPRLTPLANNGGSTRTHALSPASPAINAGDDATCAATPVNSIDQRGMVRPFEDRCDIGAFELTTPPHADLVVDFGSAGLWNRHNTYAQLHAASPDAMVMGDIDGSGQTDLIADFPGAGVWVRINNTGWYRLHASNASAIVTGDLDGNGQDEVLIVFRGFGLWVWANNNGFYHLHPQDPNCMVVGDLDGNGQAEVILNFAGQGIWAYENNATWKRLHDTDAVALAVGDLDGGGRADLLADFHGFGLWVYSNDSGWFQLHGTDATVMTAGDIDGNGQADAIISFPGFGVWAWMSGAGFKQLHTFDAAILETADIDGNGRADVIISFPGAGLWAWMNDTNWTQLHDLNPEGITVGNLDGL